ncbi:phage baseplate assembly protein V [Niabella insulamsoli]|uniref:phage baseplate assembly protein V n=1 Tax=Niabella insulamsoli TaxID=3144874 RepID=UPI0031FDC677
MEGTSAIAHVEIKISGFNDDQPVIFSNLVLNEALLSVNGFSFMLRPDNNEGSLAAILDIKKQLLGKNTEINLGNLDSSARHIFKGYITEVNAHLSSDGYYEFYINGCGKFGKVNEIPEYHSYYKKSLSDILKAAFKNSSLASDVEIDTGAGAQHFIVQYNRAPFAFAADLASRFGEWMYYDGDHLKIGAAPEQEPVELHTSRNEISNLNIRAKAVKAPAASIGTDIYKSEIINADKKEPAPDNDFLKASLNGGSFLENPGKNVFISSGFSKDVIKTIHQRMQEAIVANSVYLTGHSHNAGLSIGSTIKIIDTETDAGSKYIITQISHNAPNADSYTNSFTAIPVDVKVPPYTNPLLFPKADAQAAVVTDNEDDKGLARVKVKFPWMAEGEKSPWISVSVPHAGKGKGFRFLPEIDDEVLVNFWDGNAEQPYVSGAVYTEAHQANISEAGNHIKSIGSKTARRFEINDKEGTIKMVDFLNNDAGNIIMGTKKDDEMSIILSSGSDSEFLNIVISAKDKAIGISGMSGGSPVVRMKLDMQQQKVTVFSQGDISVEAGGNLSMQAGGDVSITAGGGLSVTAGSSTSITTGSDFSITAGSGYSLTAAQNAEIVAGQNFSATAAMRAETVAGAEVKISAGGQAALMAPLVRIN